MAADAAGNMASSPYHIQARPQRQTPRLPSSRLEPSPISATSPVGPTPAASSSTTTSVPRLRPQPLQQSAPSSSSQRSRDSIQSASQPSIHPLRPSPPPSQSRRWSRDSDVTLVPSPRRAPSPYSDAASHDRRRLMTSNSDHSFYDESGSHKALPAHNPRPLIDLVTNDWRKQTYRDDSFDSDDSYSHFMSEKDGFKAPNLPAWLPRLKIPRRVQRYLVAYLFFLIACWIAWLYWLRPAWAEERRLDDSLAAMPKSGSTFGANTRPEFTDMVHLQQLDAELVPSISGSRRLIFIGDVHGCPDELQKLLDKVNFRQQEDHVILTGDLISKGPDSLGAVDLAMKIGASSVRGNHEDRTILAHNALNAKVHPLPGPEENPHVQEDFLDEESFSHGDYKDRALAKVLSDKHIKWLKKCPVVLRVGPIGGYNGGGDVVVVHAGLVPGVKLERQDPFLVMNMRTIDLATRVPSEDRKGEPWEKLWNHHQSHTHPPSERTTVIYGHDSKRGIRIEKYSKGIDSSCVNGGKLTALVIDHRGRQKMVSVDCKKYKA